MRTPKSSTHYEFSRGQQAASPRGIAPNLARPAPRRIGQVFFERLRDGDTWACSLSFLTIAVVAAEALLR